MLSILTCSVGVHAADRVEDLAFDVGDRLPHALAAEAGLVAVAQFHRLVRAGRGAGRAPRRGPCAPLSSTTSTSTVGIAAAVEDFAGGDVGDGGHDGSSCSSGPGIAGLLMRARRRVTIRPRRPGQTTAVTSSFPEEISGEVAKHQLAHRVPGLDRGARPVRLEHDIVELEQRLRHVRFIGEHVDPRAAQRRPRSVPPRAPVHPRRSPARYSPGSPPARAPPAPPG